MKAVLSVIGGFVCFVAIIFLLNLLGFQMDRYFMPRQQALQTQVFKESAAYNDGMIRDLENLRLQYLQADDAGKALLKDTVVHRFSVYPAEKMPFELQQFYTQLTSGGFK